MAETARSFPVIREAVASFPDRAHFRRAVSALLACGFRHDDLSVLASHQPLAAAEGEPSEFVAAGLSDELKYIAPLTVAGIVLISGGPIAATVAALVGAGLGGGAQGILRRLRRRAAPRRFRGGAEGWRRAPLGALRGSRARAPRGPHPRRMRWPARPHPRPSRDRLRPRLGDRGIFPPRP